MKLCYILCLLTSLFTIHATAQSIDAFKFDADNIVVGTTYHYQKSNIDGSRSSYITIHIAAEDKFEVFKWSPAQHQHTLVAATMDWDYFSVKEIAVYQTEAGQPYAPRAKGEMLNATQEFIVALGGDAAVDTVSIPHVPWHSYDLDFASLNLTLRFSSEPENTFTFSRMDFALSENPPRFKAWGSVQLVYQGDEIKHDHMSRRYTIDGPGLNNNGGTLWVHEKGGYVLAYAIAEPDEPGYESGKLQLLEIEKMTASEWKAFIDDDGRTFSGGS